jgi:transcription initiation factor TFIIF subunit alpha
MSEASGNESTRKKKQKLKVPNLKRPGSPEVSGVSGNESSRKKQKLSNLNPSMKVAPNRKVSALKAGAGSGSESENSKRLKGNRKNTPSGSRAASPAAQSTGSGGVSRSGSPSG